MGSNRVATYERVEFCWTPSLEHMAVVNLAICLWRQPEITEIIERSILEINLTQWYAIEKLISNEILKLRLPEPLQNEVMYVYQDVGMQIYRWIQRISRHFEERSSMPRFSSWKIVWTAQGMLEERASVEGFLLNRKLDLIFRLKLACLHCCDAQILSLYRQLDSRQMTALSDDYVTVIPAVAVSVSLPDSFKSYENSIVHRCLTRCRSIGRRNLPPFDKYDFISSLTFGSRFAAIRFYNMLSKAEQSEAVEWCLQSLEELPRREAWTDLMVYILSVVDAERQKQLLVARSFALSRRISLDCRWRRVFPRIVYHLQEFISGDDFLSLLSWPLQASITNEAVVEIHKLLVRKLWRRGGNELRKYVLAHAWDLFVELIDWRDVVSIKLMLASATDSEMRTISSCSEATEVFICLAEVGQVEIIDILIGAMFPLAADASAFKERLFTDQRDIWMVTRFSINESLATVDRYLDWRFTAEKKSRLLKSLFYQRGGVLLFSTIVDHHRFDDLRLIRDRWFSVEDYFVEFQKTMANDFRSEWNYQVITSAVVCLAILDDQKLGSKFGGPNFQRLVNLFGGVEDESHLRSKLLEKTIARSVCSHFFELGNLPLASAFLGWLLPANGDRYRFVKDFFLCDDVLIRFSHFVEFMVRPVPPLTFDPWKELEIFLAWFRPTARMIFEFKRRLINETVIRVDKRVLDNFLRVLDTLHFTNDDQYSRRGSLGDVGVSAGPSHPFLRLFSYKGLFLSQKNYESRVAVCLSNLRATFNKQRETFKLLGII